MISLAEDTTGHKRKNELRMPFAEWLYRMSEARLAPQARELAIYAVVFKVTSNEELAKLAGMETIIKDKAVADKTYNRWKKKLLDDGWVILKAVTAGRLTTIEVFAAFGSSPVTFTDLAPKNPRRFYESRSDERTVEVTDDDARSAVEVTDGARNSYAPAVEPTAVSCARLETPSGLNNTIKQTVNLLLPEQEASARGGQYDADFPSLNGTAFDIVGFIAKYTSCDEKSARKMLKTNVQVFGPDVMMEAYASTVAEMAEGMVATPYKYLIGCARKGKDRPRTAQRPTAGAGAAESRAERYERKIAAIEPEPPKSRYPQ